MATTTITGMNPLSSALAAEWTKLWSLRSTWMCVAVAAVLVLGPVLLLALNQPEGPANITPRSGVAIGVMLAQFALVPVAALIVTGEYASGAVRTALMGVPQRGILLLAKALVMATTMFLVGLGLAAAAMGSIIAILGDRVSYDASGLLGGALSAAGYLVLLSLFVLGLGAILRNSAGAITAAIGVLAGLPMVLQMMPYEWAATAVNYLPLLVGQFLVAGATEPHTPWQSVAILAAWAAPALLAGYALLRTRDA